MVVPMPMKLLLVILIRSVLLVKKIMEFEEVAMIVVVAPWSVRF